MAGERKMKLGRRQFFQALGIGAAVASGASLTREAAADNVSNDEKRKARYQANSPEVQTYYRVNRYPGKAAKGQ